MRTWSAKCMEKNEGGVVSVFWCVKSPDDTIFFIPDNGPEDTERVEFIVDALNQAEKAKGPVNIAGLDFIQCGVCGRRYATLPEYEASTCSPICAGRGLGRPIDTAYPRP